MVSYNSASFHYGNKAVMTFGMMGAGKSQLGNAILGNSDRGEPLFNESGTTVIQTAVNFGLRYWDLPGLGNPMESRRDYTKMLLAKMDDNLSSSSLNFVIVKKAKDFRDPGEFMWYAAVIKAIMQKDANFDFSNLIMALTFAESDSVSSSQITEFWVKLWEASGLKGTGQTKPSSSRVIRCKKNSTP